MSQPFAQRKGSYSLFPVDDALSISVKFLKNQICALHKFILSHAKNFWHTAGIENGSLLRKFMKLNALPLA